MPEVRLSIEETRKVYSTIDYLLRFSGIFIGKSGYEYGCEVMEFLEKRIKESENAVSIGEAKESNGDSLARSGEAVQEK